MQDMCFVSKMVTEEGFKVGYMYRVKADGRARDSGWRFLSGLETPDYTNCQENFQFVPLSAVCELDSDVSQHLQKPVGSELVRSSTTDFVNDEGQKVFAWKRSLE